MPCMYDTTAGTILLAAPELRPEEHVASRLDRRLPIGVAKIRLSLVVVCCDCLLPGLLGTDHRTAFRCIG